MSQEEELRTQFLKCDRTMRRYKQIMIPLLALLLVCIFIPVAVVGFGIDVPSWYLVTFATGDRLLLPGYVGVVFALIALLLAASMATLLYRMYKLAWQVFEIHASEQTQPPEQNRPSDETESLFRE